MLAFRLALASCALSASLAFAGDWPQFRGPNATGVAEGVRLPEKIGADKSVIWKVELPPGHSSPIVAGDNIYVTAVRDKKKLVTIALDSVDGKVLWERESPYKMLEKIHTIGSHAQS